MQIKDGIVNGTLRVLGNLRTKSAEIDELTGTYAETQAASLSSFGTRISDLESTRLTVKQSVSATDNYRPLLLGAQYDSSLDTLTEQNAQTYVAKDLKVNPSSGLLSVNSLAAAKNIYNDRFILYPDGGNYRDRTGSVVGYLKIVLPVLWTNTMLKFSVSIYNYKTQTSVDYIISGYNYSDESAWKNVSAISLGQGALSNLPVRFWSNETNNIISIGEVDTIWSYPQVQIHDVVRGFQIASIDPWLQPWSISFSTDDFQNYTESSQNTVRNPHVAYGASVAHATTASKLAEGVGSSIEPVYINSSGVATKTTLDNMINGLSTASSTPIDADYFISQYVGGGTTTTTYHRRPISKIYDYIKGKHGTVGDSGTPVYFNAGVPTACDTNGANWNINAVSATKLKNSRTIFGQSFNGEQDVVGHATFYYSSDDAEMATKYKQSAIWLRETGKVENAQTDMVYAPAVGFQWKGLCGGTLLLHSDGQFYLRATNGTASATLNAKFKGDGSLLTNLPAMGAATASTAGTAGVVPAPTAGAQTKYLRGDGTWQTPTNTNYYHTPAYSSGLKIGTGTGANDMYVPLATTTTAGAMSADDKKEVVYFVQGTQTAATGSWTGVLDKVSALYDGLTIRYWLPYAGSGSATLNLTLSDGTTTGAKNCYYGGTTRLTTHYGGGNVIELTYRENVTIGSSTYTGWWAKANYTDGNSPYCDSFYGRFKARSAISGKKILVGNSEGYVPLAPGAIFDINCPILYNYGGASINANAFNNASSSYFQTMAYNINLQTTITGWTGVYGAEVFVKGTLNGTVFTIDSTTAVTCSKPTAEDGFCYLYLGICTYTGDTTSNKYLWLDSNHPVYIYKNGAFRQYSYDTNTTYTAGLGLGLDSNVFYNTGITDIYWNASTRALMLYKGGSKDGSTLANTITISDSNVNYYHTPQYTSGLVIGTSNSTAALSNLYVPILKGASGTANGTAGVVPAPKIADAAKYLRGDGTWQTINIPILPEANSYANYLHFYPTLGSIALRYRNPSDTSEQTTLATIDIGKATKTNYGLVPPTEVDSGYDGWLGRDGSWHSSPADLSGPGLVPTTANIANVATTTPTYVLGVGSGSNVAKWYLAPTGGAGVTVVNNLTSTSTTSALAAAQGKALNDKIEAAPMKLATTGTYNVISNTSGESAVTGSSSTNNFIFGPNHTLIYGSSNVIGGTNNRVEGQSAAFSIMNAVFGGNNFSYGNSNAVFGNGNRAGTSASINCEGVALFGFGNITTQDYSLITGKYNKQLAGMLFNIGFGTGSSTSERRSVLYADTLGNLYGSGTSYLSGADYAEMFEFIDGNENQEDRRGLFVTLQNNKIKLASEKDFILGVVSGNPSVVGDVADQDWKGKYLTDIYGTPIYERVVIKPEQKLEDGTIIPEKTELHPKLNPEFDPSVTYIPRLNRPEWAPIGLLGKLVVRDDGSCYSGGFCKCGAGGIATVSAEPGYWVLERLDDSHIRILFK